MTWEEEKQKLNEKLVGLSLLRIEDGEEIDLIFGKDGRELFKLSLFYSAGYVGNQLTQLDC